MLPGKGNWKGNYLGFPGSLVLKKLSASGKGSNVVDADLILGIGKIP